MKYGVGKRRKRCLIAIEILSLKDGYNEKWVRLEFIDLAIAGFNCHSITSMRYKNTRIQLDIKR